MILVDTGPLVAAFDPRDPDHAGCLRTMKSLGTKWVTTIPVLTESFHLLRPPSGRTGLMDFVLDGGVSVAALDHPDLRRCSELMLQYADAPMDFADASLVAVAERSGINQVFTLDRRHFSAYRMRRGHRSSPFTLLGPHDGPPMVREPGDPADDHPPTPVPIPADDAGAGYTLDERGRAERALQEAHEALDRLGRTLRR